MQLEVIISYHSLPLPSSLEKCIIPENSYSLPISKRHASSPVELIRAYQTYNARNSAEGDLGGVNWVAIHPVHPFGQTIF